MNLWKLRRPSAIDLAGCGVTIMLTVLFGFGVVQPLRSRATLATYNRDSLARERKHLVTLKATIENISADMEQVKSKIASSPVQLLPLSKLNTRVAELASLASECHLMLLDLKPGESTVTARCRNVPILLTGNGNYIDVARIIELLHDRQPDVEVIAFKLVGNFDQPILNCKFELQLSWRAALDDVPGEVSSARTVDIR